jgi:sulfoxide reductase heme-binding subunit YedZ
MIAAASPDHLFWITSRAAGTAALLFSSVSVGLGLAMAMKLFKGRAPDLRISHEALSLATLVALGVHVVSLLGDAYMHPSVADLTVPFVSGYKAPWMSVGIVAGWAMLILGLSFYARRRIGQRRWRAMHRFTSVAWLASIAHALGAGTDAGMTWFVVGLGVVGLPAAVLLAVRWLGDAEAPRRAVAR